MIFNLKKKTDFAKARLFTERSVPVSDKRIQLITRALNRQTLSFVYKFLFIDTRKATNLIEKRLNNIIFNLLEISKDELDNYILYIYATQGTKTKRGIIRKSKGSASSKTYRNSHFFVKILKKIQL